MQKSQSGDLNGRAVQNTRALKEQIEAKKREIEEKKARLSLLKEDYSLVKEKFTTERNKELSAYMEIFMLFVETLRKD